MDETKDTWRKGAGTFMAIDHTSQKVILHPRLAAMVNECAPKDMLDFGCGDGRILTAIEPSIGISAFDTSAEMLRLVRTRSDVRIKHLYSEAEAIPADAFDLVLMSMVVICLRDRAELEGAFRTIARVSKPGADVLVATSHPCFRQYDFSNFHTSFGRGQELDYLKPGVPFKVTIEDSPIESVTFTDYHWSLSDTVNAMAKCGLSIVEMIEPPDDLKHSRANRTLPTFLIIKAKKA